ncbi:MAG: hypothetical protein JJU36_12920 [Phycisphaeraceae bacterium]|nr:hypothetical protein [Phycisphaeraceae bacterium]
MASILRIAAAIKSQGVHLISDNLVRHACEAARYTWRNRMFAPVQSLRLFVLQVLDGNVPCRAVTFYERSCSIIPLV